MFRKFLCLNLIICLLISSTLTCFASDFDVISGSAFAVDERLLKSSLLAASVSAPVGSSTDPFYVRPFTNGSATVYRYTWSTSNPNGSAPGSNQSFTNFADIVTHITSSIANSFLALGQRLHYDNDAIYGRLYDILSAVQTSASPEFWVSSSDNHTGIFPSSSSSYWSNISSRGLKRVSAWYLLSASGDEYLETVDDLPLFQQLKYILITSNTSLVRGLNRLTFHNSGDYSLYSMDDMTSIDIPDSYSSGSLWDTTIRGFSNLSYGLSKLAFVLANDDDIALRQSQSDNVDSLKANLTSGDVSLSPSKIVGAKNVGCSISDSFSSSASISDGLSILNSGSDSWSWFSNDVSQSLDSSSSNRLLKSERSSTPYLDSYYREVAPFVD